MKRLILSVIFIILVSHAYAQYERPGSSSAQFLKIGVSPRASAMGEAYVSAVNGAEGAYYNSASITTVQGTEIIFNHNSWFAGISHSFGAVAHNFEDWGSAAISVTTLRTDEMNVTTPLQPDGTGETFYAGNYRIGLSYARKITDQVSFGGTINYLYMTLYDNFNASAVSADIGVLYETDFRGFSFGMQISNFGSDITFVNEGYPLPTNFSFGADINAVEIDKSILVLSVAATKPNEGAPVAGIGTEYSYNNRYYLRAGYKLNNEIAKYSFGAGLAAPVAVGYNIRVDYSYSSYELLGAVHRFGLSFSLK